LFNCSYLSFNRINCPNKEQTFVLLNDLLTYLLPANNYYSFDRNYDLLKCVPFLAQLMLKLSLTVNKKDSAMKWIFWNLGQVKTNDSFYFFSLFLIDFSFCFPQKLMKFNGNLRTYRNSFTTNHPPFENYYSTTNNNNQPTSTTATNNNISSQNNNNPGATAEEIPAIRSGSPQFTTPKRRVSYKTISSNGGPIIPVINLAAAAQKTPANNNADNFAMGETPFKDLAPDTSAKAPVVQTEYKIGDVVDGQCTLPGGHKRWFPGKILEVKKDKTQVIYIIQFNDGEISSDKSVDEVRFTKNRQAKKSSNNNNNNNNNTNNQTTTGSNSMDSHLQPVTLPQPKSNPPPSVVPLLSINKPNKNNNSSSMMEKGLFPDAVNSPEMLLSPCTEQTISPLNSSRNQLLSSSIPPKNDLQKKNNNNSKTQGEDTHPVVVPILLTASLNSMSFVKQVDDFTEREEDAGTSDDEQSEEDRVFEIPSIFDSHHRNTTNKKALEGMQLCFIMLIEFCS
jgi:hypothetical protein